MEVPFKPGAAVGLNDKIRMETHKNSALAIGAYPTFRYNASSGGGLAEIVGIELGRVHVRFDPEAVKIPALTWRTDFHFSAAGFYKVILHVDTDLSTEEAKSKHHNENGSRLDRDGNAVLVGVGNVALSKSWLMNKVLGLPTDVLGLMRSKFTIHRPSP